jgi:hypothetical protein
VPLQRHSFIKQQRRGLAQELHCILSCLCSFRQECSLQVQVRIYTLSITDCIGDFYGYFVAAVIGDGCYKVAIEISNTMWIFRS